MKDVHVVSVDLVFAVDFAVAHHPELFALGDFLFNFVELKIVVPHHGVVGTEDVFRVDIISIRSTAGRMVGREVEEVEEDVGRDDFRDVDMVEMFEDGEVGDASHDFVQGTALCAGKVGHRHVALDAEGFGVLA